MFERSGFHFFTFRGIDVAVSPWYLLLMAFYMFSPMLRAGSGNAANAFFGGLMTVLAITVSLIVHEFGHGFVAKFYRLRPSILLHGFGGLCSHDIASSDKDDALVVFAGPAVQLVFAGGVFLLNTFFLAGLNLGTATPLLGSFVYALIFFSVFWALLNLLLPIWPLDGGQLFHLFLRRLMPEDKARALALRVSIFLLIPLGIFAFLKAGIFLAILIVYILMYNFQLLNSDQDLAGRASGARAAQAPASAFQDELLEDAERALADEDFREAYRVCHQLRSTGAMPDKMLARVWEILAVSAVAMERFEEAASYLERAPNTALVRRAREAAQPHLS